MLKLCIFCTTTALGVQSTWPMRDFCSCCSMEVREKQTYHRKAAYHCRSRQIFNFIWLFRRTKPLTAEAEYHMKFDECYPSRHRSSAPVKRFWFAWWAMSVWTTAYGPKVLYMLQTYSDIVSHSIAALRQILVNDWIKISFWSQFTLATVEWSVRLALRIVSEGQWGCSFSVLYSSEEEEQTQFKNATLPKARKIAGVWQDPVPDYKYISSACNTCNVHCHVL